MSTTTFKWLMGCLPVFAMCASLVQARPVTWAGTGAPSGEAHPSCPWVESTAPLEDRVDMLMRAMSLKQKVHELHGWDSKLYAGQIPAIAELCIPQITFQDGPGGVGDDMQGVTQLPAPVALAATWNPQLAKRYGVVIGAEDLAKGINVDLGPTINIVRDPRWGRSFETLGEDPLLTGVIASAEIRGIQSTGTMAQLKHLALYNQEKHRHTALDNVVVTHKTAHEVYLRTFRYVLEHSDPSSIMCSYNWVNGTNACQNTWLLTRVLRHELHFDGFVTSDWGGTHSTVAAAKAGLDMEMPDGQYYGKALLSAVRDGKLTTADIDRMVRPVLAEMFRFHLFRKPVSRTALAKVSTKAHRNVALRVAEQGVVLLKNRAHVLPLGSDVKSIAIIGSDAKVAPITAGGGSAVVLSGNAMTPYDAIRHRAGGDRDVRYAQGTDYLAPAPTVAATYLRVSGSGEHGLRGRYYAGRHPDGKAVGTAVTPQVAFHRSQPITHYKWLPRGPWSGVWTGELVPPKTGRYVFTLRGDESRFYINGHLVVTTGGYHDNRVARGVAELVAGTPVTVKLTHVQKFGGRLTLQLGWWLPGQLAMEREKLMSQAVKLAAASDVAIVFAGNTQSEGHDLSSLDLPANQNDLISAVSAANPHTIVVLNTGSAVHLPWLGSVRGLLEAWYPGQEGGKAVAAIVFGDKSPSGRLPVTFPRDLVPGPTSLPQQWPGTPGRVDYAAPGLAVGYVGYRWYAAKHRSPQFPFGFGLSYTSFKLSQLVAHMNAHGGQPALHARVTLANSGHRQGTDIVQIYVRLPGQPLQLAGFKRVALRAGASSTVTFSIPLSRLATWSESRHEWEQVRGKVRVMVGESAATLPLQTTIDMDGHRP